MYRNIVVVSPYFPPSTLAGVHRARHLAKHLPSTGWAPIVICVDERFHEQRLDTGLAQLMPGTFETIKVGAVPARLSRIAGIGEISLRAWRPLQAALFRTLTHRKVDAVLITGSPYYPMLFAPAIKRRFKVRVILDFQDPWVSAWGAAQPLTSKAGLSHRLAALLEPRALRAADYVTSVSDMQNAEMAARYPWLDRTRMAGIPIGGDPDDFEALRALTMEEGSGDLDPRFINLSFVGTFMPRSGDLVRALFRSFARLRETHPSLAARIRLNFVGTSNQPNDTRIYRILPFAEAEGVAAFVQETPQRLPYLRALNILARSDGLLLIGSDEPHYTASKIYPALMSGRPFVSLFHRASSAHEILSSAGGGIALAFSDEQQLAALEERLSEALHKISATPSLLGMVNPACYAPYEARATAQRFADIFERSN